MMALGETIAALMPEHPARAMVIRLCGSGEAALSERVYSQCWMPFGQRRQICCEQIEIVSADASLADLPPVVLPLAVPDLPLMLWCRSPRLCGHGRPSTRWQPWPISSCSIRRARGPQPGTPPGLRDQPARAAWSATCPGLRSRVGAKCSRRSSKTSSTSRGSRPFRASPWSMPGAGFETSAAYLGHWAGDSLAAAGVHASLDVKLRRWYRFAARDALRQ